MNNNTIKVLEFEKIKERLSQFTVSDLGKKLVNKLEFNSDINTVLKKLKDTTEAKEIMNMCGNIPLQGLHDITETLSKVEKGYVLNPKELITLTDFLRGCRKVKKFMDKSELSRFNITSFSYSITELMDIEDEINNSIEGNIVSSSASNSLSKIRKQILIADDRIEKKVNSILSSSKYKSYIQDFYISKRNDRIVIPVKASYKNMIEGNVIDKSSTGATVFIEPHAISKLTNELLTLKIDEEKEEYQVLSTLSGIINLYLKEIKINVDVMKEYDFIFAKAKYSNSINGIEPKVNNNDYIKIIKGTHPLLEGKKVPLDFEIGKDYRTLMITGPNTGGKTIVLKTVGILTMMTQCGLHINADEGTEISVFNNILLDIGDNQSIEMSLSTFSSHIKNIIDIIDSIKDSTLILLDEIGTGTDPLEGAGLAASILEEMYNIKAITIATTHYGELKDFANQHSGFENACMQFDKITLSPLYKLIIGKGGSSNALWISKKLGMKEAILKRAEKYIKRSDGYLDTKYDIEEINIINCEIKKEQYKENKTKQYNGLVFEVGDNVIINSTNEFGIIYKTENEYGNLVILVKGGYKEIHKKRVKLYIKKDKLYPEGYDMNTIFTPYKKLKLEKDIKRGAVKRKDFSKRLHDLNK